MQKEAGVIVTGIHLDRDRDNGVRARGEDRRKRKKEASKTAFSHPGEEPPPECVEGYEGEKKGQKKKKGVKRRETECVRARWFDENRTSSNILCTGSRLIPSLIRL